MSVVVDKVQHSGSCLRCYLRCPALLCDHTFVKCVLHRQCSIGARGAQVSQIRAYTCVWMYQGCKVCWIPLLLLKQTGLMDPSAAPRAPTPESHLQALTALLHLRTASAHMRIPFYSHLVWGTKEDRVLQDGGTQLLQQLTRLPVAELGRSAVGREGMDAGTESWGKRQQLTQHMRLPAAEAQGSSAAGREAMDAGAEDWGERGRGVQGLGKGVAGITQVSASASAAPAAAAAAPAAAHSPSDGAAPMPAALPSMGQPSSTPSPPSQAPMETANKTWLAPPLSPLPLPTLLPVYQSLATLLSPSMLQQATSPPARHLPTTQLPTHAHASMHREPPRPPHTILFTHARESHGRQRPTSSQPPHPQSAGPSPAPAHASSTHPGLPEGTLRSLLSTTDQLGCLMQDLLIHGPEGSASAQQLQQQLASRKQQQQQQQQGAIAIDAVGLSPIHR
eukprot:1158512-Pelagomonas_calceolata.AAC.6